MHIFRIIVKSGKLSQSFCTSCDRDFEGCVLPCNVGIPINLILCDACHQRVWLSINVISESSRIFSRREDFFFDQVLIRTKSSTYDFTLQRSSRLFHRPASVAVCFYLVFLHYPHTSGTGSQRILLYCSKCSGPVPLWQDAG